MCGINGIYPYREAAYQVDRAELVLTRDHMAARGPDGAGLWLAEDARIGFGHRRLAIIDLTNGGAQPMANADGSLVVTFNGEIYNYRELRAELEAAGHAFRTHTDTEVLLQLYARHGAAMVARLRGMFAFAIWDKAARRLFLARDPYGIKPLYVADNGRTFRFASQVKALMAGGGIGRELDPAGIVGFHLWGHVPEPFTMYRAVRALPAGTTMTVDRTGAGAPVRYHSVSAVYAEATPQQANKEERAALIETAVGESVKAHLLADVEVGVFLSAGIDSGAILGLARDAGLSRARAITLSFDASAGGPEDEAPLAAEMARAYGAEHIVRRVNEAEFRSDLPAILDAMDQPSIDGVNTWFVAKAAKEAGLSVALSGLGGDELLAGYPSFRDVPAWNRRYGPLARIPGLGRLAQVLFAALGPGLLQSGPKAAGMFLYAGSLEGAYLLRRGLFLPHELPAFLDPDLVAEGLRLLSPLERLRATLTPDPGSDMARVAVLEACHYMRDQLLRDADWAGMAHSVEIRTPLVDSALLARIAPLTATLEPGEGKAALASAPSKPLPRAVATRPKTGFDTPLGVWMATRLKQQAVETRGEVSRLWARHLLAAQRLMQGT